jgi:hypothetical protein
MGEKGGENENTYLIKAGSGLSRVGATMLINDPGSVPEAGGECSMLNAAVDSNVEDFEPA